MIISHRHKFIFTAIPKTGTHSIRRALRDHLGEQDQEQVRLFVQKVLPYPEIAKLGHGHVTLEEIRPAVGEAIFNDYLKFAFVRNPFDRFVSYCAFVTRAQGAFARDPKGIMRYFLDQPPFQHVLFRPQFSFVTDASGRLLSDFIGRAEELQSAYDQICALLHLPTTRLEQANSSTRSDYRSYYDPQLIDGVKRIYGRDLDLFGYEY